ncbi:MULTISPECIES: DUF1641 domain-containing protein [Ignavibacterium]|jgi:uncharacterized protein YjgD (DUF1641 family)|uniref:DUF1641 domain-containing protein n=1 Tax=Ignavibacterium TaxID=795750 RepID=UPI0025C6FD62|nr:MULTISPECIES: DUF1641 domain-containing protein [Ignavibacterium]MBI5661456.1 DUF1641 domain-containing protein [Ignavibacterium album]
MDDNRIQIQLDEINKKLDFILGEIDLQRKHRLEIQGLKEDLTRVAKDVYLTSIEELEQVHDYIKTGDILHLFKKLLRNINNLTKLFEQLENLGDFLKDFSPISKEMAIDFMHKLDELDRKGYFTFIKETQNILDHIVTSFTVEDVKALGDNIVTILNTVKNLTQPDMLHTINNALNVYKKLDIEVKEDISLIKLIKELNHPETKKALYFSLQFLKSLSSINQNGNKDLIQTQYYNQNKE